MAGSSIELKPSREGLEAGHTLLEGSAADIQALRAAAAQADAAYARLAALLGGVETRIAEVAQSAEIRAAALHAAVEANVRRAEEHLCGMSRPGWAAPRGGLAERVLLAQRSMDEMHATDLQLRETIARAEEVRRALATAMLEAAAQRDRAAR